MNKLEVFFITVLVLTLVGLFLLEADKADKVKDLPIIKLPSGEEVYRYDDDEESCFYTKFRIINCQVR
jgi:hypothetical protein